MYSYCQLYSLPRSYLPPTRVPQHHRVVHDLLRSNVFYTYHLAAPSQVLAHYVWMFPRSQLGYNLGSGSLVSKIQDAMPNEVPGASATSAMFAVLHR